jgi:predicted nucleotidyltransferase
METPINPVIEPIVREFKAALQTMYGDRLHGVILYGSYARGDYDDESDIDLMVLLNDEQVNTYGEIRKIMDVETEILLKYGLAVSPLPVANETYKTSRGGVYQEARREGLIV